MVTRIYKGRAPRLFLREHRKAKGISATTMGGRINMERESVLRLEREWSTRCTAEKQAQYAQALGIEPGDLWHPPRPAGQPEKPSLDDMTAGAPQNVQDMVFDVVRRMTGRG